MVEPSGAAPAVMRWPERFMTGATSAAGETGVAASTGVDGKTNDAATDIATSVVAHAVRWTPAAVERGRVETTLELRQEITGYPHVVNGVSRKSADLRPFITRPLEDCYTWLAE